MYSKIAAVFLAHKAVMAIDVAGVGALADALPAATATGDDPGAPCNTPFTVISSCVASITNFDQAPVATQAACLCCYSTIELADYYSSCASALSEFAPTRTQDLSVNLQVASFCSAERAASGDICAGTTVASTTYPSSVPASTTATPTGYPSSSADTSCSESESSAPMESYPASETYSASETTAPEETYPAQTYSQGSYSAETSQASYPSGTYPQGSYSAGTSEQAPYPTNTEGSYPTGSGYGIAPGSGGYPTSSAASETTGVVISNATPVASGPLAWAVSFFSLAVSLFVLRA